MCRQSDHAELPSEHLSPLAESIGRVLADRGYEVDRTIEAIDDAVPGIGGLFDPNTDLATLRSTLADIPDADPADEERTLTDSEAILYVDGSSRGNPGPAGAGAVIQGEDGETLVELGTPVGSRTDNNTAEYVALYLGVTQLLARFDPKTVEVRIDSMTVIRSVWQEQADPGEAFREYRAAVVEVLADVPEHDWTHLADSDPNPADALATVGADIADIGPGG
jgi:ribonuclease HI